MRIDVTKARNIFAERSVHSLYHSNTVATSCSFLANDALLSRHQIEARGLVQTPQQSDAQDKLFKIWNDLFFDSVDIHERAAAPNFYGPVLFVFPLEVLTPEVAPFVSVTRTNPISWKIGQPTKERYFTSARSLHQGFIHAEFGQHIVLKDVDGILPLTGRLTCLVVDDPGPISIGNGDVLLLQPALNALRKAARAGGLKYLRIRTRGCHAASLCKEDYRREPFRTMRKFAPTCEPP